MVDDRSALSGINGLDVPRALRPDVEEIVALTDELCAEHLDAEYARLCAALLAKLSRKRPSPLLRGWHVQVGGLIVDARMLPVALQDECRRRRLIPNIAAGA